ncbi:hypothetical protein M758_3G221600 [Ceratodon purpureus]|nr:hypothetical protein M758_3G221600 [Ceratodon purpureus]
MASFHRQWASRLHTSLMVVFLLVTFTCACQVHSASMDPASDVYERLETYGFPEGLLPHIVTGYTLEPDGKFTLYLESKCQVLIEGKYPLIYNKVISGMLSYGKLQGLKGITVKAFYIWWNISGIALGDDESLFFDIGILSTKFSCDHFDDPPICEVHSSAEAAFMDPISFHFI